MLKTVWQTSLAMALLFCSFLPASAGDKGFQLIENRHQWPAQVRYQASLPGGAVFLTHTGFTYSYYKTQDLERIHDMRHEHHGDINSTAEAPVHIHAWTMKMEGCNPDAAVVSSDQCSNYYNYFQGNDRSHWAGAVPAFRAVRYKDIYTGIDLDVHALGSSFEYDFLVAAGADVRQISLSYEGVQPYLDAKGNLVIRSSVNVVKEQAPVAYQLQPDGTRRTVDCRYVLKGGRLSFAFPHGYDASKPLVIDPVLVFATYSGGTGNTFGWSATYDAAGCLYAGGECFTTGWPTTTGAFQIAYKSGVDVGVNKYSSNGSNLIYSTYYGGAGNDLPNTMIVNDQGELVMAGATNSYDLPVTATAFDTTANGLSDIYVVHFNAAGSALIGSTYIGGSGDEGSLSVLSGYDANRGEVFTDAVGNIFFTAATTSANFPVSAGAYQQALRGSMDAFVIKLNRTCSNLIFSTYLGGSDVDAGLALLLTSTGNVVVSGGTRSTNFPNVAGGWQSTAQGNVDGFVAILNSTGTNVLSATYIGTTGIDNAVKIQIDPYDNIYAVGLNSGSFPVSAGAYSVPNGRIYVARFSPNLSTLQRSTTIGSSVISTSPSAFMLDKCGYLYYTGYQAVTSTLPITPNAYQSAVGGFWMCVLSPNMAGLSYATFFGGPGDHIDGGSSRLDPLGIIYHSICTASTTLPTTSASWSPAKMGTAYDIASWKFNFQANLVHAGFSIGTVDTFCAPATIHFTNLSTGGQYYRWSFGNGQADSLVSAPASYTFQTAGVYRIRLYAYDSAACNSVDSAIHTIVVRNDSVHARATLSPRDTGCLPYTITMTNTSPDAASVRWVWGDNTAEDTAFVAAHTYTAAGIYTVYCIAKNPAKCHPLDTMKFTVVVAATGPTARFALQGNDTLCFPGTLHVQNTSLHATSYSWDFGDGSALMTDANPAHTYADTGHYTVRLIAKNNTAAVCIPEDTMRAEVWVVRTLLPELETKDVLVCEPGDSARVQVKIRNERPSMTIGWSPATLLYTDATKAAITVAAHQQQRFSVQVSNTTNGLCPVSSSASVLVTPIPCDRCMALPNAFTPNNDGRNDVFRAVTICPVTNYRLRIYDRWGELVYTSYNPQDGWDGSFRGQIAPLGTYFYSYTYTAVDGRVMTGKGDLTLIR